MIFWVQYNFLRNEPIPLDTICEQIRSAKIDSKSFEPNQRPTRYVKERKHVKGSCLERF